jgi:hypothetical protein
MSAAILLAAGLALASGDGLAPEGKGYPSSGGRYWLVLRSGADPAGNLAPWRLLLSEAQTDAPVESAVLDVSVFGPAGLAPIHARARAGEWPGHYLADLGQPAAGKYAAAVIAAHPGGAENDPEVLAVDGIEVASSSAPMMPSNRWSWGAALAALVVVALVVRSLRPAAVATLMGLLAAGGATAHDLPNLPGDEAPRSQVELAQELQFALGIRTQPVEVRTFAPPSGSGFAPRQEPGVPRSAVVERDAKKLVLVRLAPERFAVREVQLGWRGPGDTVAVARGLQPGERVVIAGAAFLRNGGGSLP